MQATAHTCIWTVTHRPLPPSATGLLTVRHDSGADLTKDASEADATLPVPQWIHPPTSTYTQGTATNPTLPASQHPNRAWLSVSARLHGHPPPSSIDAYQSPIAAGNTQSTLTQLESLLAKHGARPLALLWLSNARDAGAAVVHMPLDTGLLVRLTMHTNPFVPVTNLTSVVLDPTLAEAAATGGIKTVRDEYRNWMAATRQPLGSVHEAAAKRVASSVVGARELPGVGVGMRWGAAVVAPHFIACYLPAVNKVRLYFSVSKHKLVNTDRDISARMGTPTMVEVELAEKESGGGALVNEDKSKVKLQTLGEHLAAVGDKSVWLHQIRETSGVVQVHPTSTLSFGTDSVRLAHLSWGSTLITLIQSSSPTTDGSTELWIRGYAFNTKSHAWDELDAHGPVLSLPAADTGDVTSWTVGEPVLTSTFTASPTASSSPATASEADAKPVSKRSKAARSHAMSVLLGTSTGRLIHLSVQFSPSSVSWNRVQLTQQVTPVSPNGIAHLAMHPGGCFVSIADTLGRVAVVDLMGKPVALRHAFTATASPGSATRQHLIQPLQTLGFNAPPLLVSWVPAPHSRTHTKASQLLPGKRSYVPTAAATGAGPSTLLLVFDRGPIVTLAIGLPSTSLLGYARHLLARGAGSDWSHVLHLATHLPMHMARDITTLGHMLLTAIDTLHPSAARPDPMWASGAYHAQVLAIAARVLDASSGADVVQAASALARKVVLAHLTHGRLDAALAVAASLSIPCSDLLHLVAMSAAQRANARGLAAAAHFQFLKTCPGPYPPLLTADPAPASDMMPSVDELVDLYTREVASIAAGAKPAFGLGVKRLAMYLEVSGQHEEAMRWWRRLGYDEDGRRGWERVAQAMAWRDGKRVGRGEGDGV